MVAMLLAMMVAMLFGCQSNRDQNNSCGVMLWQRLALTNVNRLLAMEPGLINVSIGTGLAGLSTASHASARHPL